MDVICTGQADHLCKKLALPAGDRNDGARGRRRAVETAGGSQAPSGVAEGLFDAARKKPLPHIPESIGVITSPSGAVIHDILHRLADRFPRHVMVWPVAVQGPGAAEQIAAAINGFNELEAEGDILRPAVLIVARGGGSLEDLMPFNEEIVVRAIAASHIPVISAVGHETDNTLCDLVADWRSPTPTAAAERAVPVRAELVARLRDATYRLQQAVDMAQGRKRETLSGLARGLAHPRRLIEVAAQTLDDRAERLATVMIGYVRARRLHLERDAAALKHPRTVLAEARVKLTNLSARGVQAVRQRRQQDIVKFSVLGPRLSPAPLQRKIARDRAQFSAAARHLESLSYKRTLERGFVVVRGSDGHAITVAAKLKSGQDIMLEFSDKPIGAKIV